MANQGEIILAFAQNHHMKITVSTLPWPVLVELLGHAPHEAAFGVEVLGRAGQQMGLAGADLADGLKKTGWVRIAPRKEPLQRGSRSEGLSHLAQHNSHAAAACTQRCLDHAVNDAG